MPRLEISVDEIFYAARGRNELSRSHAPFVFIHGAGADHLVWNGQLAALATLAPTFALDLPAHGRSSGAGRKSILEYALAVHELLDALKLERARLVGHSMGGAIAQTFALEFPERAAGLVLVGTGAKLRVAPQFLDGIKSDLKTTARALVDHYFAENASAHLKEKSFAQLLKTGSDVTYNDFAACDAFDVRERVKQITCPTLLLCGRFDKMTPPHYSEYLAQQIPHARFVLVEHAGHMVMLEQPATFNLALRDELTRASAPSCLVPHFGSLPTTRA